MIMVENDGRSRMMDHTPQALQGIEMITEKPRLDKIRDFPFTGRDLTSCKLQNYGFVLNFEL